MKILVSIVLATVLRLKYTEGLHKKLKVLVINDEKISLPYRKVRLVPENADVWENADVTLSCDYEVKQFSLVSWYLETKSQTLEATMQFKDDRCNVLAEWLNTATLYTYGCTRRSFNVSLKSISRTQHGNMWSCKPVESLIPSNVVTLLVKVPVQDVNVRPNVSVISANENDVIRLTCTTSQCRPEPSFYLFVLQEDGHQEPLVFHHPGTDGSDQSIREYNHSFAMVANRTLNHRTIVCRASNRQNASSPESGKISMNITYGPNAPLQIIGHHNGSIVNVIRDQAVNFTCSISGGNPRPTLEWNVNTVAFLTVAAETVMKTIQWVTSQIYRQQLQCSATHFMGTEFVQIFLEVLYPPSRPTIRLLAQDKRFVNVSGTVNVRERENVVLQCTADSKPPTNHIYWIGSLQSSDTILNKTAVLRSESGTLTCFAVNNMNVTVLGTIITGQNSTSLNLNILYPPKVTVPETFDKLEGEDLNYECRTIPGNPNRTTFLWSWKGTKRQGRVLQINNVTRGDSGAYTCTAENIMVSSDGSSDSGTDEGTVNLNVQYRTAVLNLTVNGNQSADSLTVAEDDEIKLHCYIEGNPIPIGDLHFQVAQYLMSRQHGFKSRKVETSVSGKTLRLTASFSASCTDAGLQTCIGRNSFYNRFESEAFRNLFLYVKCKPRPSPFYKLQTDAWCFNFSDVTFSFTALAYPVPKASDFTWSRKENNKEEWTELTDKQSKISIVTTELQSNLTVQNVTMSDYGIYHLRVKNEVGLYMHMFMLKPVEKPQEPMEFREVLTTATSISVEWKHGFNGGVLQEFVLLVSNLKDQLVHELSFDDNNTDTMTTTVEGLDVDTVYKFVIYARNEVGNSTTVSITVKTKGSSRSRSVNLTGAIGGGASGLLALVIAAVVVVVCKRRHQQNIQMACSSDKTSSESSSSLRSGNRNEDEEVFQNVYDCLQDASGATNTYRTISLPTTSDEPGGYESLALQQIS